MCSYGLYSYGLYALGLCIQGHSYGLYSYGLYSYGLYIHGLYIIMAYIVMAYMVLAYVFMAQLAGRFILFYFIFGGSPSERNDEWSNAVANGIADGEICSRGVYSYGTATPTSHD